jgi:hypothetical protein
VAMRTSNAAWIQTVFVSIRCKSYITRSSNLSLSIFSQTTRCTEICTYIFDYGPITVAARSKVWTVFARSNAGIVGSNPTQGMDVYVCGSRVRAVGIATGYGLDDRGVGVRVPLGSRIFCSPRRPDRLSDPRILLSNGYRGPGREADHSLTGAEVKKMWIYISTPPYAFMV